MKAQTRVLLLDSNSYFRLGISIHPLLSRQFGKSPRYRLYVIEDLDKEFGRSGKLQSKFHWVNHRKYSTDRAGEFKVNRKDRADVDRAFGYLCQAGN